MKSVFIILMAATLTLCSNPSDADKNLPTQKEVNKGMEEVNRQIALEERAQIDGYIERHDLQMESTGTGLRYSVYYHGNGMQAKEGMIAMVNYKVSLLDGTALYSSKEDGAREFIIGQDNIESGIHEGICFMHEGDKALFILPSHLAHGLSGDNDKIPPRSTVVYDLELLGLK